VTPSGGGATVEAIGDVVAAGVGEASCVGNGTLLGAPGWSKRPARAPGVARRSFSPRVAAVLREGLAWPAEAPFCCPAGASGACA
jgi:hypothetical protein